MNKRKNDLRRTVNENRYERKKRIEKRNEKRNKNIKRRPIRTLNETDEANAKRIYLFTDVREDGKGD